MTRLETAALGLWCAAAGATAQESPPAAPEKIARAARVEGGAIVLDGRIDEPAWGASVPIRDFTTKDPEFGRPPTDDIEIRFAYDEDALYVGARMGAKNRKIQAPLGRRDETHQAEHLWVSLDTFRDRRTAYSFGVSASGVRMDFFHESDSEGDLDSGFDPVWEARAQIHADSWTAELRIPFAQLRFNELPEQVWGLNADWWIPSKNEDVFWIPTPKDQTGWSSRMGALVGIAGIRPTRRIEVEPYLAGNMMRSPVETGARLRDGRETSQRAGADFRMGLGPNLTLEGTIRPDFGQVEADPAEVNLSAFETFFDEKRPFFREGSDLFDSNFFYSRRIGATPRGPAGGSGDEVDYPRHSEILGALKLTGRLKPDLSVGALVAVTGHEEARVFSSGHAALVTPRVGPRTTFAVASARKQFGANASTASLLGTFVDRALDDSDPLAALYPRRALGGEARVNYWTANRAYSIEAQLGFSRVEGKPAAIERLQRSSARYFQRPDATHVRLDPSRRSLGGFSSGLDIEKESGNVMFEASVGFESPELDRNDAGQLATSDGYSAFTLVGYRGTKPGRVQYWEVVAPVFAEWNYAGETQDLSGSVAGYVTWRSFWSTNLEASLSPRTQDQRLTRGGPTAGTPRSWWARFNQSSPQSFQHRISFGALYGRGEQDQERLQLSTTLASRPSPRFSLTLSPSYSRNRNPRQYVGAPAVAGATRYVFATIDQTTVRAAIRASFTLKPDLNLDLYAEPFASSGRYSAFGELESPGSFRLRAYGLAPGTTIDRRSDGVATVTDGGSAFTVSARDFRALSFRSNLVLRWEWRPGSRLYLVWQRDRERDLSGDARAGFSDLWDSFSAPGDNVFALKASFFWNRR